MALFGLSTADAVSSLAVRPDGREVMVGGYYGRVTSWDLVTGEKTFDNEDLRHPPEEIVRTVGYLDDGRRFGGGDAGKVLIWGKAAPREIALQPSSGLPLSGGRVLLGRSDGLHIVDANRKTRKIAASEAWILTSRSARARMSRWRVTMPGTPGHGTWRRARCNASYPGLPAYRQRPTILRRSLRSGR